MIRRSHPRRRALRLVLTACLAAFVLSCTPSPQQRPTDRVVIGLMVDNFRPIHQPVLNAARLAVDEINRRGGLEVGGQHLPVVLAVEDDIKSPQQATKAAQRLINQQGISALVGCNLSPNAIPVGGVSETAKIPMISPASTSPLTTRDREYVFRVAFDDNFQGRALAQFVRKDLGLSRAAILFNTSNIYSIEVQEAFRLAFAELGGEVMAVRSYATGDVDFRPALQELSSHAPEVLLLPNYSWDVIEQGRQVSEVGLDVTLIGSDGWSTEILVEHPSLQGSYALQHWHPEQIHQSRVARRFAEDYERAHGAAPFGISALTFDAFGLLFQAIQRGDSTDPEAIRQQLAITEDFAGSTGSVTYRDQGGDPMKEAVLVQLLDGRSVFHRRLGL